MMQALLNGSFGLFVGTALWAVGVPSAALWAAVAAIMRFVPFVGSVLAAIPPLLLAAAVEPGWTMLVATLGVFAIGEPIMGHVIEPLMLGKRAGISPFVYDSKAGCGTRRRQSRSDQTSEQVEGSDRETSKSVGRMKPSRR